jgi:pilus assembly protein Flp/PilA
MRVYIPLQRVWQELIRRMRPREGQALVEYALIIALVAIAAIAALHFLSGSADNTMSHIGNTITNTP